MNWQQVGRLICTVAGYVGSLCGGISNQAADCCRDARTPHDSA